MSTALARSRYNVFLSDLGVLIGKFKKDVVLFYWQMGRRIVEEDQQGALRAEYGSSLLIKISQDLLDQHGAGFSVTNLRRMRLYYLASPIHPASDELDWSHQTELLSVKDKKLRRQLARRAVKEGLASRDIRRLVQEAQSENGKNLPPLVRPTDLRLSTFRQADPTITKLWKVPQGQVLLDCGFFVFNPVEEKALPGVITDDPSYTYAATLERVIDGDTLLVLIDIGFEPFVRDRLRLRGVNCPELGMPEGEKAKKFVEKLLPAGSLIVLKSHKCHTDDYGRFVADVFCKDPCENIPRPPGRANSSPGPRDCEWVPQEIIASGEYLNQLLLDKGLAVRMEE